MSFSDNAQSIRELNDVESRKSLHFLASEITILRNEIDELSTRKPGRVCSFI
jgi:hypothetical protein